MEEVGSAFVHFHHRMNQSVFGFGLVPKKQRFQVPAFRGDDAQCGS